MKTLKSFLLPVLLILICNSLWGKNAEDSLWKALLKSREDTNKIKLINQLISIKYYNNNSNAADSLANVSMALCDKFNYTQGTYIPLVFQATINDDNGSYAEALKQFKVAYTVAVKYLAGKHIGVLCNNIGRTFGYENIYDSAMYYFNSGIQNCIAVHDSFHYATILNNMGNMYTERNLYNEALKEYLLALSIREKINDRDGIATTLNNLGTISLKQNNFDKALDYCIQSLNTRKALKEEYDEANSMGNIADIYAKENHYDDALNYYSQALEIFKKEGAISLISLTLENMGRIYYTRGDNNKAFDFINQALAYAYKTNDNEIVSDVLRLRGTIYDKLGKKKEALDDVDSSLAIARKIGSLELIMDGEQELSKVNEELNKPGPALENYKMYITYRDSIYNKENTRKLVETQMNYDFDKKMAVQKVNEDKEEAIHKEAEHKQKIIISIVSAGLLVVLLLSVMIYRSLLQNRKKALIIAEQKRVVDEKNKHIMDSITYAQVIQTAILPPEQLLIKAFPEAFILFEPKDIVSGDFYWFSNRHDKFVIAALDCTGHGVPGAFMSMIGNTLMNEIVNENGITTPSEILQQLNVKVYEALHHENQLVDSNDGMDVAICSVDKRTMKLEFAGAKNPVYICRGSSVEVIKGDPYSIAGNVLNKKDTYNSHVYTNNETTLESGNRIYLFSDGFMDQLNHEHTAKFGSTKFRQLLIKSGKLSMVQQKTVLLDAFNRWKNSSAQLDDILVIGVQVNA